MEKCRQAGEEQIEFYLLAPPVDHTITEMENINDKYESEAPARAAGGNSSRQPGLFDDFTPDMIETISAGKSPPPTISFEELFARDLSGEIPQLIDFGKTAGENDTGS